MIIEMHAHTTEHSSCSFVGAVDLVTASASGLDPHISLAAARLQIPRIALARNLSEDTVAGIMAIHTEGRQLGLLGEPRVNVLLLNRALDFKR